MNQHPMTADPYSLRRCSEIKALLDISDAHVGGAIDADDVRALFAELARLTLAATEREQQVKKELRRLLDECEPDTFAKGNDFAAGVNHERRLQTDEIRQSALSLGIPLS